jgi:hypothetical protein
MEVTCAAQETLLKEIQLLLPVFNLRSSASSADKDIDPQMTQMNADKGDLVDASNRALYGLEV